MRNNKQDYIKKESNNKLIKNSNSIENITLSSNRFNLCTNSNKNLNTKYSNSKLKKNNSNDINLYKSSKPKKIINRCEFLIGRKNEINIDIKNYLSIEPKDMDYDYAVKRDKRKFCEIFIDNLKSHQISINTFYTEDPLKPRPIKILLFILDLIYIYLLMDCFLMKIL